tara:strand:- start:762 stop:1349 length:588 start_codon:yes stop_codon:yes gene_type:complete
LFLIIICILNIMSSRVLIVYKSPILFQIFEEIKENLNFDLIESDEKKIDLIDLGKFENYIILSHTKNNLKNCNIINVPLNIKKILEQINIWFLRNKFLNQSKIKIGKYTLDLNSRSISNDKAILSLTEKETELIICIEEHGFVSLKDLQKKVWKYTSTLETHTVETHIYRLRKKFLDFFQDNDFIKHNKKGYFLN